MRTLGRVVFVCTLLLQGVYVVEHTAYGRQVHDGAVTDVRQIHYIGGAINAAKDMPILARRGPATRLHGKPQRPMTIRSLYLSYCAFDKLTAK